MSASLVIVGTGLIGGSFALGARQRGLFDTVLGLDPKPTNAALALERGVIDAIVTEVPMDARAVLLAAPGNAIADWIDKLSEHPATLIDVASVKQAIMAEVRARRGKLPPRWVPCHPIAGSERSGPGVADAALFDNRLVIQTPAPETDSEKLLETAGWWTALGARVERMAPLDHDRVYAAMSHLPHLITFAYLQQIRAEHLPHGGGGFRDFTRIGASDPSMWSAIFEMNQEPLLEALAELKVSLDQFEAAIRGGDANELKRLIERARGNREGFKDD